MSESRRLGARSGDRSRADHLPTMLTGLLLWLCALPLVGLLILPWFGPRVAGATALGLLFAAITACYGICSWRSRGPGARSQT